MMVPLQNFVMPDEHQKTRMVGLPGQKKFNDIGSHFDTINDCE